MKYKELAPDIQIFANNNDHERIDKIIMSHDRYIGLSEHKLRNLQEYLENKYPIFKKKNAICNTLQENRYNEYAVNYNIWIRYNMKYIHNLEKRLNTSYSWEKNIYQLPIKEQL